MKLRRLVEIALIGVIFAFVFTPVLGFAAQTVCQIANGCTGTGSTPAYGQLLIGNSSGGYSLTSTSSLSITAASTTALSDNNTFSGNDTFTGVLNATGKSALATTTTTIYIDANRTNLSLSNGSQAYPYTSITAANAGVTAANLTSATYQIAPGNYDEQSMTMPNIPLVIHFNGADVIMLNGASVGAGTMTFPNDISAYDLNLFGNLNESDTSLTNPHIFTNFFVAGNITVSGLGTFTNGAEVDQSTVVFPFLSQTASSTFTGAAGSLTNLASSDIQNIVINKGLMNLNDAEVVTATSTAYSINSSASGSQLQVDGLTDINYSTGGGINTANGATTLPNDLVGLAITLGNGSTNAINAGTAITFVSKYTAYTFGGTRLYASGSGLSAASDAALNVEGQSLLNILSGDTGISTSTPGSLLAVGGIVNFTTATSTFYGTGGINIEHGCFSINGTCISGGGGGSSASSTALSDNNTFSGADTFTQTLNLVPSVGEGIYLQDQSLGTTVASSSGIFLQNTTAAAVGAQQVSPAITLEGQGWGTTQSQSTSTDWIEYVLPVQGAVPTSDLVIGSSINANNVFTTRLNLTSAGLLEPASLSTNGLIATDAANNTSDFYATGNVVAVAQATTPFAFGGPATTYMRTGFYGSTATVLAANDSYGAVIVARAPIATAASGNHPFLANLAVLPMGSVTQGASTVGNTATLYLDGAATTTVTGRDWEEMASSTNYNFFGGPVAVGTSTPNYEFIVSSSTASQIAFTDGSNEWALRSEGGMLALATSTFSATSSVDAFDISANGIPTFASLGNCNGGANALQTSGGTISCGTVTTSGSASTTLLTDNNTFGGNNTFNKPINTLGTTGGYDIDGNLILQASSTNQSIQLGQFAGDSLFSISLGNTAVGYDALTNATTTAATTCIGWIACQGGAAESTIATGTTAIGSGALHLITTGGTVGATNPNVAVGSSSLYALTSGAGNTAVGSNSGLRMTTGGTNTLVGLDSGETMTTAVNTSFFGAFSGFADTANNDAGFGYEALDNNSTGIGNVGFGYQSLFNNKTHNNNSAYGLFSLASTTGDGDTGVGSNVGLNLVNITSASSTLIGAFAGLGSNAGYGQTGTVAIGAGAFYNAASSSNWNTLVGTQSGFNLTSGADNILIGSASTTANENLTSGSDNIKLCDNCSFPSATANGQLDIGNFIFGTNIGATTGSTLDTIGALGLASSTPWGTLSILNTGSTPGFIIAASNGAAPQFEVTSSGETIGQDVSTGNTGQITPMRCPSGTLATSTTWTGTSSAMSVYGDASGFISPITGKIVTFAASTSAGTLEFQVQDGSNSFYYPASTTAGTYTESLSVTKGDAVNVIAGNPASSPTFALFTICAVQTP